MGILLELHDVSVVPFQLLRDGEQRGHLVLEKGSARFTPSHSLHGVQWLGFLSQLLHVLSLLHLS